MAHLQNTTFFERLIDQFNMLWFIMALGFGGTAVAGFAFLNNTLPRTPAMSGMLFYDKINEYAATAGGIYPFLAGYMQFHMLCFGLLHLTALFAVTMLYVIWRRRFPQRYRELVGDTQRNSVIIAPILAYGMAFNVFLVLGYVYSDWMRINVQLLLPYAAAVYGLLWLWTMVTAIRLQALALEKGFDVEKMHFGWLLIPFALAMTTVTGTGISYLAHGGLADTIFFLSIISFTMAFFLLLVKIFSLFKSHYASGLPTKIEFLPSFFVVVPVITLLTISMLRYGYYFQHKFHLQLPEASFALVVTAGFGLMTWYMALGLFMLRDYFRKYLFTLRYFDESQWGLICPMVAYGVLCTFVYKHGLSYPLTQVVTLIVMLLDVVILLSMLSRQYLKVRGTCCRAE